MARVESVLYGPVGSQYTIGGATGPQILGRFDFSEGHVEGEGDIAQVTVQFVITGSSYANLATNCNAAEAALIIPYGRLDVIFSTTTMLVFDPSVSSGTAKATGFNAEPSLKKIGTCASGLGRIYEFSCKVQLPPNYSDVNITGTPAAAGRRTSTVSLHWDTFNRRVVTITGKFTEIPNVLPRAATTTAQTNDPSGTIDTYCAARLAIIDNAATWSITRRDEQDDNTQAILTFSRDYTETLHGRSAESIGIDYLPTRQRVLTCRGTYVRTYAAGPTTTGATAQYEDATNGGYAFAVTQLAALTAAQGGPLVPNQSCKLISERAQPNEQDDRLDYTLIFEEVIYQESLHTAGGIADPDIVLPSITFVVSYVPLDDSVLQSGGPNAGGDPNPLNPTPGNGGVGGGSGKPSGTQQPMTLDKSVVPPQGTITVGTVSPAAGTNVTKPVDLFINYKANLKTTILNPRQKWTTDIVPWLISQWAPELGFPGTYLVNHKFDDTADSNVIAGFVHGRFLGGDVLSYRVQEATADHLGKELDEAYTGTPYEYLMQQAFPGRTKVRKHTVVFKTNGAFDPTTLATQDQIPGYVVMDRSAPDVYTSVTGLAQLGIPTQSLTYVSFVEVLQWVGRAIQGSSGTLPSGAPSSTGASTASNSTTTGTPVAPTNQGGT